MMIVFEEVNNLYLNIDSWPEIMSNILIQISQKTLCLDCDEMLCNFKTNEMIRI